MKNFYNTIFIVIIIFFAHTHTSFAMMRATFPDSKSLQPLPPDTYPNISGNTNSSVESPKVTEYDLDETETPVPPSQEIVTTSDSSKSPNYILWSIIALAILVTGFVFYFKKRKI